MSIAPDTKSTTLFTLAAFKIWLKTQQGVTTTEDERLVIAADAATEEIENEASQWFVTRATTDRVSGDNRSELILRHAPVPSVTSLTINGSVVSASEYVLDSDLGLITLLTRVFDAGVKNVSVSYTSGFDVQDGLELPRDVYRAGLDLAKAIWDELTRNAIAVSSVSMGPVSTIIRSTKRPLSVQRVIEIWKSARIV